VMNWLLKNWRAIGFAEGVSFLVLLAIAMPLKYWAGMPLMVTIVGGLHGGLWIAYVLAIWLAKNALKWSNGKLLGGFAASILPFGPFVFDSWVRANNE